MISLQEISSNLPFAAFVAATIATAPKWTDFFINNDVFSAFLMILGALVSISVIMLNVQLFIKRIGRDDNE